MDPVELVNKYGFPIVMAVGMGFIIKYVWTWATTEIKPVINDANAVLIALIDRIRMLDNDLIRLNQKVNTLSGGNQQRVVLGKWLATRPKILLVDEPTRGVDVSAKAEIHKVLKELAKNGMGIIVVSSELSELLQITERILVICRGQLVANVETQTTNTQELMELSTGEKLTYMDKS